jgi:hypothetical protein
MNAKATTDERMSKERSSQKSPTGWFMSLGVLASVWTLASAAVPGHRLPTAITALIAGTLGFTLSAMAVARPRYRWAVAAVGLGLALSSFAFPDTVITAANQIVTGLLLVILGLLPRIRLVPVVAVAAPGSLAG